MISGSSGAREITPAHPVKNSSIHFTPTGERKKVFPGPMGELPQFVYDWWKFFSARFSYEFHIKFTLVRTKLMRFPYFRLAYELVCPCSEIFLRFSPQFSLLRGSPETAAEESSFHEAEIFSVLIGTAFPGLPRDKEVPMSLLFNSYICRQWPEEKALTFVNSISRKKSRKLSVGRTKKLFPTL